MCDVAVIGLLCHTLIQGLSEKVTKLLATRRTRTRRRTSSPSVHSSILTQVMPVAVLDFKPDVKRPTGCRVIGSFSLLGAPARTLRAPRAAKQHERARRWHLQLDSWLQSSSHATGGCHVYPHSQNRPVCSVKLDWDSTITTPTSSTHLGGACCQSSGSWFVVEYVTSALDHIGTMPGPTSSVLGTAWDAAGERRRR